jgi:hypothetical protein
MGSLFFLKRLPMKKYVQEELDPRRNHPHDCYSKTPVNTLSCVSPSAPSMVWKRLKQSIKPLETFLFSGVAVKCSNRVATALLTSFFSRMAIFAWKIVAS